VLSLTRSWCGVRSAHCSRLAGRGGGTYATACKPMVCCMQAVAGPLCVIVRGTRPEEDTGNYHRVVLAKQSTRQHGLTVSAPVWFDDREPKSISELSGTWACGAAAGADGAVSASQRGGDDVCKTLHALKLRPAAVFEVARGF
jgi:hypothetical protein